MLSQLRCLGVVKLQLANDAPSLGRRKGFVECGGRVRVQMVKDDLEEFRLREVQIDQIFNAVGEIGFGAPVGDLNMPPAHMGLYEHRQVAGAFAFILVIVALRRAGFDGQRLPSLADQLIRTLERVSTCWSATMRSASSCSVHCGRPLGGCIADARIVGLGGVINRANGDANQ
jgi:hypothetical protein